MKFIKFIFKSYERDKINILSAYGSFFIVASFIPFIALVFFALSELSPSLVSEFENLLSRLLPSGLIDGFSGIISQIKENRFSSFIPISVLTAIWTSSKGIGGLCRGVEAVYGKTDTHRGFLNIIITLWRTLLFYIMIILSLLIFSLGRVIFENINSSNVVLRVIVEILAKLRFVAFGAILAFFFSLLYARLNDSKNFFSHTPGGLFSAVGWLIFTFIYSKYISYALSRPSIYLGMGGMIFFMLWIYFCIIIVLLGAEVNKYYQSKE